MTDRDQIQREIEQGILKMQHDLGITKETHRFPGEKIAGYVGFGALIAMSVVIAAYAPKGKAQELAQVRSRLPKIEGCATPRHIILTEAYNRGNEYKDAFVFLDEGAQFLSRWAGLSFPGVGTTVVVTYSDGSASINSFVGHPECWRQQVMERRK